MIIKVDEVILGHFGGEEIDKLTFFEHHRDK